MILRLAPEEHIVHFNLHHIAGDAWSVGILVREVTALFEAASKGAPSPLPELPVQYADYAGWQRSWLRGEALESLTAAWTERLAGAPPVIDLPRDGGGGKAPAAALDTELPPDLTASLEELGRRQQTSLFMTLLAALDVTLHSFSGAEDLVVGGDIAHRSRLETEGLIGFFINQIVLRVSLAGDPSFGEILERAREASLFAYEHQDLPFDKLVEAVNPDRGGDHAPIFQVKLVVQNTPTAALRLGGGLEAEALAVASRPAREELLLNAVPAGEGLALRFKYDPSILSETVLQRLARRLRRTLELAAEDPERSLSALVSHLEEAERAEQEELAAQRGSVLGSKLKSRRRRSRRGTASKPQGER